jgi:hypothetical protein
VKSKWIKHKGKRIFYSDCTDFGYDARTLQTEIEEVDAIVCAQPENSVFVIVDVRGTVLSSEAVQLFKAAAVETKPYARKTAVVGITGYRKVLSDAVAFFSGRSFGVINDLEEAKDWVVEGD